MTKFMLVPSEEFSSESNTNQFYIEMIHGATRPRMVTNQRNPPYYSRILATTRSSDGYRDPEQALWKIEKVKIDDKS